MDDTHPAAQPSGWVLRFAGDVPAGATVLDLACGRGRHARMFLERGCRVTAVDRDAAGVADLSGRAEILAADLENARWPLGDRRFDVVVVTNYLWRPLLPRIIAAVAPGGLLLYETFLRGQEKLGRPRNPDFLLQPGELLAAVRGALQPVVFEQGRVTDSGGKPRLVQRLCAVNGGEPFALP